MVRLECCGTYHALQLFILALTFTGKIDAETVQSNFGHAILRKPLTRNLGSHPNDMVIFMPVINSKETMESLLKEVLELQKDIRSFIRSKTDDPAVIALALHTACTIAIDEEAEDSQAVETFDQMSPRLTTIVALGHDAVLKSLRAGSYETVFSVSVEIGAMSEEDDDCPYCNPAMEAEIVQTDSYKLN